MMAAAIQRQAGVKASLEELARVGASRAEDVRLLAEMQASLEGGALPPQIVARLGTECALREDWRRGRADEALRGLGAPLGGMAASAASALIEAVAARLLDDARLMADGLHRRALPWQRTLVAAASRIAADALDVARSALAEAEGAEAEGAALLDALQLALIETPAAELGSALALLTATARALVADPTAAAASAAAAPCVQPGTTSAPTLDSFVRERLRRRYDAQREGAARILQRRARVLLARRGLARAARARRVARLRALLRAGTGRRIATALAWLWQLRGWRRAARAARRRERAAAAAAAAAARAAYALLNASERTGWHAASRVQAAARGARARRRADALRDGWPVRRLQAAARGMLGRSAAARVAASRALRARRARAAAWARQRAERGGGTAAMMRKWLSINLHVTAELGAIDAELERERRRFEVRAAPTTPSDANAPRMRMRARKLTRPVRSRD
jgi:hypothetical protein